MRRILLGAFFIFLAFLELCFAQDPLNINHSENWIVKYTESENKGIYSVVNQDDEKSVLLLYSGFRYDKQKLTKNSFPETAQSHLDFLEKKYKDKYKTLKYRRTHLIGLTYRGLSIVMEHETGFLQCHLIVTNGNDVWEGLFNGSEKHWNEVVAMLNNIK